MMTYDLAIIGGGPAGVAAGVYAARKRLKTIFITKDFTNQSAVSENIQNWIGTVSISGIKLADDLKNHLMYYRGEIIDIHEGELAERVEKIEGGFKISTKKGSYTTATILVCSGSSRRKIDVSGAAKFDNKGLTYCASCDGPLFGDMDVAVIGGGNAAFETAAQLLAYCKNVTLLHRSDSYRADEVTIEKVLSRTNMKAIKNVEIMEVKGESFVNAIVYKDASGKTTELPVKGIFVEIGSLPNTSFIKDVATLDNFNRITVDPKNQRSTSTPGIWAAGDCTDGLFHQNNIAAGDAVKALEDLYLYIHTQKK